MWCLRFVRIAPGMVAWRAGVGSAVNTTSESISVPSLPPQVKLQRVEYVDPGTSMVHREYKRVTHGTPSPRYVPHFGYVSLFPLLLKLLPPVRVYEHVCHPQA